MTSSARHLLVLLAAVLSLTTSGCYLFDAVEPTRPALVQAPVDAGAAVDQSAPATMDQGLPIEDMSPTQTIDMSPPRDMTVVPQGDMSPADLQDVAPPDPCQALLQRAPRFYWSFESANRMMGQTSFPNLGSAGSAGDAVARGTMNLQVPGRVGQAARFDGVDDHLVVDHDPALSIATGTIAFWFRATDPSMDQAMVSKDGSGLATGGHVSLFLWSMGKLRLRAQDDTTDIVDHLTTDAIMPARWYHVAVVFTGARVRFFLDGAMILEVTSDWGLSNPPRYDNREQLILGADPHQSPSLSTNSAALARFFDGALDEVAIYDEPLDQVLVDRLADGCPLR